MQANEKHPATGGLGCCLHCKRDITLAQFYAKTDGCSDTDCLHGPFCRTCASHTSRSTEELLTGNTYITMEAAKCICEDTIWEWHTTDSERLEMLLQKAYGWWEGSYEGQNLETILKGIGQYYYSDETKLEWVCGAVHQWMADPDFREIRARISRVCGNMQMQVMQLIMVMTRSNFVLLTAQADWQKAIIFEATEIAIRLAKLEGLREVVWRKVLLHGDAGAIWQMVKLGIKYIRILTDAQNKAIDEATAECMADRDNYAGWCCESFEDDMEKLGEINMERIRRRQPIGPFATGLGPRLMDIQRKGWCTAYDSAKHPKYPSRKVDLADPTLHACNTCGKYLIDQDREAEELREKATPMQKHRVWDSNFEEETASTPTQELLVG